jgi:hypothetical protein
MLFWSPLSITALGARGVGKLHQQLLELLRQTSNHSLEILEAYKPNRLAEAKRYRV